MGAAPLFVRLVGLASLALAAVGPVPVTHAQLTADGPSSSRPAPAGTVTLRWPDVAYDPEHDVFLAVSGAGVISGYWFSGDGAALEAPFVVDDGGLYAQAPRVVYASGLGFVVSWHETVRNA